MNSLINDTLRQLSKKVAQLDDKLLESSSIASKLHEQLKIQTPVLLTDKTEVTIGKEKVVKYDVPKGFSPGQTIDFVLFTVPIEGSYDLFAQILKNHSWSENFNHFKRSILVSTSDAKVFFKEISPAAIVGNSQLIEKIKSKAGAKFDEIKQILEAFQSDAEDFNKDELGPAINKAVGDEIAKRNLKKAIEAQLNPFV